MRVHVQKSMESMDSKGYCHGPQSSLPPLPQSSSSSLSSSSASSSHQHHQHQHLQQQQQHQHTADHLVIAASSQSSISSGGVTYAKTKSQLNAPAAQYVNCVPVVPVGVQYHPQQSHRRKYAHQVAPEYQSRLYYAAGDYVPRDRCRDDLYAIGSQSVPQQTEVVDQLVVSPQPPQSTSSSLQQPPSQQQQQQQQHQQQQHQQQHQQQQQQHHQHQHQQQQLQQVPSTSVASQSGSSVLYTVQRVVTTSQIQTAAASYAPNHSSSVSSVTSIARSEIDCNDGLQKSPGGPTTSTNYQSQQLSNSSSDQQQTNQHPPQSLPPCLSTNGATLSSASYATGASTSSSIPRPLQNVIPTCVYLMSRIAVHMEIEGTAQCPAQVMLAAALGCEELGIANKLLAQSIFGLWMSSPLLELQLKPHHRPYAVRTSWGKLLEKQSHGNALEKKYDEPMITLRRNVFFSKRDEEKIKDARILELLYEEARHNVLTGRYIMEPAHSIMLGGIQARIELGPYNTHTHTISYFRESQTRFLPQHVAKNTNWSWLPVSRKTSAEVRLLEQFKRVPTSATTRKLMRKYLEFCWALPFYGAAFFHGQVEQPVRGLMSLVHHKDIPVLIAINEKGVFVIDHIESTLLLGLKYEELSWDFAKPSSTEDLDCLPCIFIQFDAVENGIAMTKLMQVFSRQAAMMDALISHFADQMRRRREGVDGQPPDASVHEEPNPIQNSGMGVLSNKLARLTLATFDDEGRCIGQQGSLSISY